MSNTNITHCLIFLIFSQNLVFGAESGTSFYERIRVADPEEQHAMVRDLISNPAQQYQVLQAASPTERQAIMRALLEVSRAQDRQRTEEWLALSEDERRERLEAAQESRDRADEIEARFRAAVARHQDVSGSDGTLLSSDGEAAANDSNDVGASPEHYIDRWRFRSVLNVAGEFLFSLHNPWDEAEMWIGLGEKISNVRVRRFDADMRALDIESEGMTRTIFLAGKEVTGGRIWDDGGNPESEPSHELNEFHERWMVAVRKSDELRKIEQRFDEISNEIREAAETRAALVSSEEPISGEELHSHAHLLVMETTMLRREAYRLAESLVQGLREHDDFRDLDLEIGPELMRYMMRGRSETER